MSVGDGQQTDPNGEGLTRLKVPEQASLSLNWLQTPKTGFLMMWLNYYFPRAVVIQWRRGSDVVVNSGLSLGLSDREKFSGNRGEVLNLI